MSAGTIGAALGLLASIIQFVALRKVVTAMGRSPNAAKTQGQQTVMKAIAWIDLAVMPALGWLVGTMAFDGTGL